ncbi:MAG: tetraacyldisaccharide 4'-kinase [Bacteroidales bacterium]|nr:tetraacyldisaccharide 4'-kinase [Bacteroidales bacterium]
MIRSVLLYPFGLFYGLIMAIRNLLYDFRIIKSHEFDFPVISVGNLTMGGTGKTPHVEYLIRKLSKSHHIAIISRGYGRKTRGFILADNNSSCGEIGDEPLQYVRKFKNITVAVDENRVKGIRKLKSLKPEIDIIICDDAFQHRRLKAGLSILLTDFHLPFNKNYVFPAGNLREFRSGYKRSDIIIVTKTERVMPILLRKIVIQEISPLPHQQLFFSHVTYGQLIPITEEANNFRIVSNLNVVLFTGISNPYPLERHLTEGGNKIEHIQFRDHHSYSVSDMHRIVNLYKTMLGGNKVIITTEKDAMRLLKTKLIEILNDLPVYYLPIEIKLHRPYEEHLGQALNNLIEQHKKQLNLFD